MSVRRSPAEVSAQLRFLLAGVAAAGLLSACGMPQPVEPPPPPEAEMEAPELYGAAEGEDPIGDAYAEAEYNAYADTRPAEPGGMDGAPPVIMAEETRPGWGTMDPIPNPPASSPSRNRALAQADVIEEPGESGMPRVQDRLGAYATGPAAPPPPYAQPAPPPPPSPDEAAPYSEGSPAASYPPVVVQMQPVPNPPEGVRTPPRTQAQHTATTDESRRTAAAEAPRPAVRAAADQRLLGGPARAEQPARQAAATSARTAESSARAASATVRAPARPAAAERATPRTAERSRPAAQKPAAAKPALPAANTPEGRTARLKRMEGALAQLVQRDSTLAVPASIETGRTERITLTLPQGLTETLTREAREAGLRDLVRGAEVRTALRGENWTIEPEEPQSKPLRAGESASFVWQATPERGAGPLSADVDAALSGGGKFETLQLGEVTREIEGAEGASDVSANGLSWRAIGAALLLLALLIGALFYARRGNDEGGVGRRYNRRRPDPVNLTPYSAGADTDATRDRRGDEPEPARP